MSEYNIKLSENRDFVVLTVVGDFTGKDMLKYIIEAHALGKESGINLYLVNLTKGKNIDSVVANYDFAYSDIRKIEGIDFNAKVAALISPGDHSHDFIETVLCNSGMPIKLFTDPDMALDYLLGE